MSDLSTIWLDAGWWVQPDGQRRLLSWNAETKELKLWAISRFEDDTVLTTIDTETEVRQRLEGWADHNDTADGLAWLTRRLEGCQ